MLFASAGCATTSPRPQVTINATDLARVKSAAIKAVTASGFYEEFDVNGVQTSRGLAITFDHNFRTREGGPVLSRKMLVLFMQATGS